MTLFWGQKLTICCWLLSENFLFIFCLHFLLPLEMAPAGTLAILGGDTIKKYLSPLQTPNSFDEFLDRTDQQLSSVTARK